jgi:hypothetical protein
MFVMHEFKKEKGGDKEMLLTGNKEDLTCRSKEKAVGFKKKKKGQPHMYLVADQCSAWTN